ncbi:MAG TPA: UvrD-helicase domain-containing protein [Ignavibacteriaceae bacterium]|nr:UvrD-helicase domain-containing protein [Ignavibacteriaceae bacterium]
MRQLTEQQQLALNIDKHLSVTANAGSGKTMVFAKRYVDIALQKDVSLRNIAAITFTEKAASELYKKIAEELDSSIIVSTDKEQIRKLKKIRRELISANISTIHSFCIDILREHPVEAGIDANFTPIEPSKSNELIELSVNELFSEYLEKKEDEEIKYLIRLFASKENFRSQLVSFINERKNLLELKYFYDPKEEEIKNIYEESAKKLIKDIFLKDLDLFYKDLEFLNNEILIADKNNDDGKYVKDKLKFLKSISDEFILITELHDLKTRIIKKSDGLMPVKYIKKVRNKSWYNDIAQNIEALFGKIFLIHPDYQDAELEMAKFSKLLYKFFLKALNIYNRKKYELGYLDFEDILINTKDIIENVLVQKDLTEKYQYIMVDEYQDTNELQYNIFLPILEGLKKGNLFVVGDEKQSIYGFRDAELQVFDNTKKNIKDFNEEGNIQLPHSFRMAPEICLFTNYVFRNLFSDNPNPLYNEVNHSDLICGRSDEVKGKVEIIEASEEEDNEAELISKKIIRLIKYKEVENISWQNIAILCRKRKSFDSLETAFVKYKIPFTIVGGRGFYQRQSIYDFYNYFSFLLDSNNNLALVGILRSPFFSFSDSLIYQLSLQQGNSYWEKLNNYKEENELVKNAIFQLTENLRLINLLELAEVIRKILAETPYLTILSSKEKGIQEVNNIEKLIDITIQFSSQGFVNLYDYILYLKDAIDKYPDESQAEITEDSDSVKIMTLHQAKGLEFSAVFLYNCSDVTKKNDVKAKEVYLDKEFGIYAKVPTKENYFGDYIQIPLINVLKEIKSKKELAEAKRLFYVGVTRAKDYLCISYTQKKKMDHSSFTYFLMEGLKPFGIANDVTLSSKVEFLNKESRQNELTIPVIREFEEIENEIEKISSSKPKNMISVIKDIPEGDMFSATRYTKFKECPLKYQLTYEYGLLHTIDDYKEWLYNIKFKKNDEVEVQEEKLFNQSMIKGSIIHEILSENIPLEDLESKIDSSIKKYIPIIYLDNAAELKNEFLTELTNFYNSDIYKEVNSYKKVFNEYEIYTTESNFILYGIIDKIAFCEDKIIIVDYKTDKLSNDLKTQLYLNQLKFYSYISSKLFKNFSEIELKLVYIKNPEKIICESINHTKLKLIEEDIQKTLSLINENKFEKNKSHCAFCNYSINRKDCIKED